MERMVIMKKYNNGIKILMAVLLTLAMSLTAVAADNGALKTYTLSRETLIQRVRDNVKRGQNAYISFYNIGQANRADLQLAGTVAKQLGGKVFICFDTLNGEEVAARIAVNPLLVKSKSGSIDFTIDTLEKNNAQIKEKFESLTGKSAAVMRCGYSGDFGMSVLIVGKLDISKLNKEKLTAYLYDPDKNTYKIIKNAQCMTDESGFVYLQSKQGGYIVITSAD